MGVIIISNMNESFEDEYQIVLSRCSSNVSYTSIPIIKLYSMNSAEEDIYKRIHQKFLTPSDIYTNILVLTQKLTEKTNLDHDLVLFLLHKYKWNEERLEEQYFAEQDQEIYHNKLLAKKKSIVQEKVSECAICCEDKPLVLSGCGHGACIDCWRQYIEGELVSKSFFKCINQECQETLYHSFIMKVLQAKNKYLRNLAMEYAQYVKSISACPGINCQLFFEDTSLSVRSVLCECGTRYCFKCRYSPHEPCSCKEQQEWLKITKSEKPNEAWLKSNTKICPGCGNNIERSLGCNLIACNCGVNFCYNCGKSWDQNHKDHFKCPLELSRAKSKKSEEELHNITIIYSKFIIANSIQKKAENEYKRSQQLRKELCKVLQIPQGDSLFLKLLCDVMVRGYMYIKWTEVFEYLRRDNAKAEEIIRFRLEKLRDEIEKCSILLVDFKSKINSIVEDKSEYLNNKGTVLKKFYQEKEVAERILKQTEIELSQFLEDMKNL